MVLPLNQSATPGLLQCTPISLQAPWYQILHHRKLLSWRSGGGKAAEGMQYFSYKMIYTPKMVNVRLKNECEFLASMRAL